MAKTKEEGELEYERLRMGKMRISGDADENNETSKPVQDEVKNNSESDLDSSISASEAAEHKARGNELYKAKNYADAMEAYAKAASSAHAVPADRATYLANLAAAHLALGAHKETVSAASECLEIDPKYRKARERRFFARKALDEYRGAAEDARELGLPNAQVVALEMKAKEKEEKTAAEAMEQLKGLGNSLLSNFGLSLDNFKAEKDPNTGSYSIQMKQ